MPYIKKHNREELDESFGNYISECMREGKKPKFAELFPELNFTVGKFNYFITLLCHSTLLKYGFSYREINDIIGTLECVKLEFYRMIAAKYEDKKRLENGAISDLDTVGLDEVR